MLTHNARLAIGWQEIQEDAKRLADQLSAIGQWRRILAIPRGGLIPATLLAHHLNIQEIDLLKWSNGAGQPEPLGLSEDGLLIVDELVDTGKTIKMIKPYYSRAHVATLYAKPIGRPMADSFVKEFPQDVWLDFPWERSP